MAGQAPSPHFPEGVPPWFTYPPPVPPQQASGTSDVFHVPPDEPAGSVAPADGPVMLVPPGVTR